MSREDILLTMMERFEAKLDAVDEKLDSYSPRVALVEHRVAQLEETVSVRSRRSWEVKLALFASMFGAVGTAALAVIGLG